MGAPRTHARSRRPFSIQILQNNVLSVIFDKLNFINIRKMSYSKVMFKILFDIAIKLFINALKRKIEKIV
jgi:hypothetical protein